MANPYILIDAPGHYLDVTTVYRTFKTLEAAEKAAKRWNSSGVHRVQVIENISGAKKGQRVFA